MELLYSRQRSTQQQPPGLTHVQWTNVPLCIRHGESTWRGRPTTSEVSFASSSHHRTVKLPKIELKKFTGEIKDWLGWSPGTRASKLVYSYPLTAENYPKVIYNLTERFGRSELLQQIYVRDLNRLMIDCSSKQQLKVLEASLSQDLVAKEQTALLDFIIHSFNSIEVDLIRNQIQKIASISTWVSLPPERLETELKKDAKFAQAWSKMKKHVKKLSEEKLNKLNFTRYYLMNLFKKFSDYLDQIPSEEDVPTLSKDQEEITMYCERFITLLIDLITQGRIRVFVNVLLDASHVMVKASLSNLNQRIEGRLFGQLLNMLKFYTNFEINDITGEPLTDHDMTKLHYDRITSLQKVAIHSIPELRKFAISNVAEVDTRERLSDFLKPLDLERLKEIGAMLKLVSSMEDKRYDAKFMAEILITHHERRISQLEALNEMPLYPTEEVIWDENIVPTEYFSGDSCLALPKLNLQFLTLHDYLLRNFHLFRLESTYEIRQDIEDAVSRLNPWKAEDGGVLIKGWARMAHPILNFTVVEVGKPKIGEKQPSRVKADITVNLNLKKEYKLEWENLRKHDVCFLITVRPTRNYGKRYDYKQPFIPQVGLTYVRGCEIEGMLDTNGRVIEEGPEPKPELPGDTRTFRVWLDCNQYRLDMDEGLQKSEDVDIYGSFSIILRRKPKENNFKAVLETIRDLINTQCVVPNWLENLLLGYGDPDSAHYSMMDNQLPLLDFNDTFLTYDHLVESFPGYKVITNAEPSELVPPFKIQFHNIVDGKRVQPEEGLPTLEVLPHVLPSRGPYPYERPKRNSVKFTPTQVEAIMGGMQPGLMMVVGPPGTGKTDVAVQIISNLYHNFPKQRTLIVTHSNQALNQLFEKIMALDIDERHLLRLGHGEEALETEKDFSRYGRVNYVLQHRIELLGQVHKLKESLAITRDVSFTCEAAGHFYLYDVLARWEEYLSKVKVEPPCSNEDLISLFPFTNFFEDAPQPLFSGATFDENFEIAEGCFTYIKNIFTQLEEFRAFELLRSGLDRSKYLLVKEAKIIAMTCTHAALKRKELVELGFEYDNILMEESAQILEIETFIPLLLQNPQDGHNRLKRWIMIGDHHQLPPVIKNMAFQKYCNMEQALFTRLVRLGVPTVDLDAQGRSRPTICQLFNWRYKTLGNLPHVLSTADYQRANPGLWYDYQLINVEDFNGVGESEPNPHFYQNLAEAEYVVALYMYMRVHGYPAEKISILTTYNGQKHLIRDVVKQRCADNPLFGSPHKITTVDKYQGQQNDYILLSLVRTKTVGHLRDVRRLVVAMSRARLGLYIFARVELFQNCLELAQTFYLLTQRPTLLHLNPGEQYATCRRPHSQLPCSQPVVIQNMPHMAQYVYDLYQHLLMSAQPPAAAVEEEEEEPMEE
ncbi:AQR [Cordylochernes scorpioides]|uniref:AQR n=1 Tax=Cordylochernes scorpioides TaxID=51811 RepID=A0ABY6K0D2_9ARAC|nr:AQR [Cordylochernes scorpioides]